MSPLPRGSSRRSTRPQLLCLHRQSVQSHRTRLKPTSSIPSKRPKPKPTLSLTPQRVRQPIIHSTPHPDHPLAPFHILCHQRVLPQPHQLQPHSIQLFHPINSTPLPHHTQPNKRSYTPKHNLSLTHTPLRPNSLSPPPSTTQSNEQHSPNPAHQPRRHPQLPAHTKSRTRKHNHNRYVHLLSHTHIPLHYDQLHTPSHTPPRQPQPTPPQTDSHHPQTHPVPTTNDPPTPLQIRLITRVDPPQRSRPQQLQLQPHIPSPITQILHNHSRVRIPTHPPTRNPPPSPQTLANYPRHPIRRRTHTPPPQPRYSATNPGKQRPD